MAEDTAIDFRQHHMHGEIARRQPARRALPAGARRSRQRHLQDRAVVGGQHAGVVMGGGGGKGGRVDDDVGRMRRQRRAQKRRGAFVLEAGDIDRDGIKPCGVERFAKGCDRRGVGAGHQRPIEDHRGAGTPVAPRLAGPEPGRRHRPRRRRLFGAADQMRGIAQRQLRVVLAAFQAIAPQRMGMFGDRACRAPRALRSSWFRREGRQTTRRAATRRCAGFRPHAANSFRRPASAARRFSRRAACARHRDRPTPDDQAPTGW